MSGKLGVFITHFIGYQIPGPALKLALVVTSLMLIYSFTDKGLLIKKKNKLIKINNLDENICGIDNIG